MGVEEEKDFVLKRGGAGHLHLLGVVGHGREVVAVLFGCGSAVKVAEVPKGDIEGGL